MASMGWFTAPIASRPSFPKSDASLLSSPVRKSTSRNVLALGRLTTAFVMISSVCQRTTTVAVDRSKFRKCADTGFCKEFRDVVPGALPRFRVDAASLKHDEHAGFLGGQLLSSDVNAKALNFSLQFYNDGTSRLKIKECDPLRERWEPPDVVIEESLDSTAIRVDTSKSDGSLHVEFANDKVLRVQLDPFQVDLLVGGVPAVTVNKGGLLHFQAYRAKKDKANAGSGGEESGEKIEEEVVDKHGGKKIVGYWEDGLAIYEDGSREEKPSAEEEAAEARRLQEAAAADEDKWEEYFGGHTDSRPHGPASVGIDVRFPGAEHLYGLPEHASSFRLKTTKGPNAQYAEPFRLYNLDVFEYELDEPMALYGSIPFVASHTAALSAGVFLFNPSETFVDVEAGSGHGDGYQTHWMSECGVLDLFLLPGPTPRAVAKQMTTLTGTQALPPLFSLGYHQCRWNYKDEKDVAQVHGKFEELDFPYDVLWLDIEHTDGKRYFTWDQGVFPDPVSMQNSLAAQGRKMVTIIDPHIKRDDNFAIHSEATAKGLYVKDKFGADFDGFCWPGQSSYLDFTDAGVRRWWAERFALDKYTGSTSNLYTWNDMNEPSVFNGPEVSMQKDCRNLAGVEHREWHNLYGMYMQRATAEGLTLRDSKGLERPFVLSRAFYAGSQRFGAIWTGDNKAAWEHLQVAAPMLLSINLAGLSFSGADVGGFFQDTDAELMTRWMQAGAFQPFFRGHAHHDTKRKEPWVYGEPTTSRIRAAVMARYTLLPYWYTTFYIAYAEGLPVMRPLWMEYPTEMATFDMDDQWLIGQDLLVKPVTTAGATSLSVYFPQGLWYDIETLSPISGPATRTVPAPLEKIPVYQRGGSIIPRKMRLRRSSSLMTHDPFTLVVAMNAKGLAEGLVYMDDEHTLKHEKTGEFVLRKVTLADGMMRNVRQGGAEDRPFRNQVERIVVLGWKAKPKAVTLSVSEQGGAEKQATTQRSLEFMYDAKKRVLTIRKPEVMLDEDWTIGLR